MHYFKDIFPAGASMRAGIYSRFIPQPNHIIAEVGWPTIFFFIGLFIIIGGIVKVGLIKWMSVKVLEITQGNMFAPGMVVMCFSAFASAFIDSIPYVATMNPLIVDMSKQLWPDLS